MMTLFNILGKLRKHNKENYRQFNFCLFLSIMLVSTLLFFVFSPFVQSRLPVGGDSRKMIYMIFAAAVFGCILFAAYATGLFLRFKSREIGVLMALGTEKNILAKELIKDIEIQVFKYAVMGIGGGVLVSLGIGKAYEALIQSVENDTFQLSITGFAAAILYVFIIVIIVLVMALFFMNQANVIDIINEDRRNEPIKENATKKYFLYGIVFIILGIFGGFVLPSTLGTFLKFRPSPLFNAFYILVLIGLYQIMVYSIAVHKRGRNPQKYYNSLISFGIMKFQGSSIVRNMMIVALLLAGSLFAVFFSLTNIAAGYHSISSTPDDVSYRYLKDADRITKSEVESLAVKYGVTISDYREVEFIRLLGSGINRDNYDADGKLMEEYQQKDSFKNFINVSQFTKATGLNLSVINGTYQYITRKDNVESYWFLPNDLDYVENPQTGKNLKLDYAGSVEYASFFYNTGMDGSSCYVISDEDYQIMSEGLPDNMLLTHTLFQVSDSGGAYDFSKELFKIYCNSVSHNMKVIEDYDEYRAESETDNMYAKPVTLYPERPEVVVDWKYSPVIVPLQEKTFLLNYSTLLLIFVFVMLICIIAAGVITYTRSITVALKSKRVLMDVKKLGGNQRYLNQILKTQIRKIYVLPTLVAAFLIYGYNVIMLWQNDGIYSESELLSLGVEVVICLLLFGLQYMLYRISLKKAVNVLYDGEFSSIM